MTRERDDTEVLPASPDSLAARLEWARESGAADSPLHRILNDPAGARFGRYRIERLLGSGGMGFVFRARDDVLSRPVALKLLRESDPIAVERLLVEARSQARLRHENVCQVYEAGTHDSIPFVAMQLVDGVTLDEAARDLSLEQKVRSASCVAGALQAAHREGVIHRDVKPGNILVETRPDGQRHPWLVDFGLAREASGARLTTSGLVVGTPRYMSPEQARSEKTVDRRVDVYGLGATLYELLAGRPVFAGENAVEVMVKLLNEDPRPLRQVVPALPADLGTIVDTCLAKAPGARYESARALQEDLERFLAGEPIAARAMTNLQRATRFARRHRAAVSVALTLGLALLVVTGLWIQSSFAAARRLAQARAFAQEAERIETSLRMAYLLPLHDTSLEKARTRERMERLEQRLRELGREARGPGAAALGRGHLALREFEGARSRLLEAWSAGYREPEVAQALGHALAALYQRGVENARRIDNRDSREVRLAALAKELRDPAREWLRRGRERGSAGPGLTEALLARLEGDLPRAEATARDAFGRDPGLFEALRLQGEVVLAQAVELQRTGQTGPATLRFGESGDLLARAAAIARSEPEGYEALCRLHLEQAVVDYNAGRSPEPAVQRGLEACGEARKADAESPWANELETWLLFWLADYRNSRGIDPREVLAEARRKADAAIPLLPPHPEIWNVRGQLGWVLAKWQGARGEDPSAAIEAAISDFREAIRIDPTFAPAYGQIGNALLRRVELERSRGLDARPTLDRAIQSYEDGIARSPKHQALRLNLSGALMRKGYVDRQLGGDAVASFTRAARIAAEGRALNPSLWLGPFQEGNATFGLADTRAQEGSDAIPDADKAIRAYRSTIELKPDMAQAWGNLGMVLALRASLEIAAATEEPTPRSPGDAGGGAPPPNAAATRPDGPGERAGASALLRQAEEASRRCAELKPDLSDAAVTLALVSGLRAFAAEGAGRDSIPPLREAAVHLERALRITPGDAETLRTQAANFLRLFEATAVRGRQEPAWLAKARDALAKAAKVAPDAPSLPFHRARLARVEAWGAVLARSNASAGDAIARGLEAVDEALRRNPKSDARLERLALLGLRGRVGGSAPERAEADASLATLRDELSRRRVTALEYRAFLSQLR